MSDDRDIEVATQLGALTTSTGAINERLDQVRRDMLAGFARIEASLARHVSDELKSRVEIKRRIKGLEDFRVWCVGAAAGVAALFTAFKAWASYFSKT